MSFVPELLEAAVAAINDGDYVVPLTAQIDYALRLEDEQEEGIRVTVTPAGQQEAVDAGLLDGTDNTTAAFDLVVSAHLKTPTDETEIKNLINLVAAIRTQTKTIPATSFIFQSWTTVPLYDVDQLRAGFFKSITTFTYLHPAY